MPKTEVHLLSRRALRPQEGLILHRARKLTRADVTVHKGLLVTTVPRTLFDLSSSRDEVRFEHSFDEALYKHLTTIRELEWCVERNKVRGREGAAFYRMLLKNRSRYGELRSYLESQFEAFLRTNGFPPAEHNYEVNWKNYRIAEVDFAWPELKVCVQTHGFKFHSQEKTWHYDQDNLNKLHLAGWQLYVVTARMLLPENQETLKLILSDALYTQPAQRRSASSLPVNTSLSTGEPAT